MITIYGKPSCGYCVMAKNLCEQKGVLYTYKTLNEDYTEQEFTENFPSARTFPQITVGEEAIGGFEDLVVYFKERGQ